MRTRGNGIENGLENTRCACWDGQIAVKRIVSTASIGILAFSLALKAHADSGPKRRERPALDEIVVTAQKRVSTVQDTPISISAVSGRRLLARGVASLAALAQGTPGVSLKSEGPSQTEIEMRGMTSSGGNSATVGFYLDDIPLAGPASAQNGHVVIDPDLYDLNRSRDSARTSRHALRIGLDGRHGKTD